MEHFLRPHLRWLILAGLSQNSSIKRRGELSDPRKSRAKSSWLIVSCDRGIVGSAGLGSLGMY
jgi:hypothetical protein